MFLSSSAVSSLIGFFLTAASSAFAFKCASIFLNRNKGRKQNAKTFSLKTAFCFSLLVGILCPLFAYFAEQNPYQHSILIFPILIFYLISVSAIDIKTHIIPDIFPLSAALIALLLAALNPFLGGFFWDRIINCLLGILCGGGLLLLFSMIGGLIYKRQTLGGGDIKFMAALGAFIGWEKIILSIFIGFCLGALAGGILILLKKTGAKGYIPFAPFLSAGILLSLLFPQFWLKFLF